MPMINGVEVVECTGCGGNGFDGFEEDTGRPYTCYRCCETGWIPKAWADAEARDASWALFVMAEEKILERRALGVPDGWTYRIDEYEGVILVPPKPLEFVRPKVVDYSDDIPF